MRFLVAGSTGFLGTHLCEHLDGRGHEVVRLVRRPPAAGRADVRLLRRYVDRGLRVRGLHTQVFSVRVLQRAPRRVVVRAVDRIVGGVAVGDGQCVPLPHDRADRRTVTLRRVGESWLVADVS
jgi:uncharacterized protein YbjT (DUF2867 family)